MPKSHPRLGKTHKYDFGPDKSLPKHVCGSKKAHMYGKRPQPAMKYNLPGARHGLHRPNRRRYDDPTVPTMTPKQPRNTSKGYNHTTKQPVKDQGLSCCPWGGR